MQCHIIICIYIYIYIQNNHFKLYLSLRIYLYIYSIEYIYKYMRKDKYNLKWLFCITDRVARTKTFICTNKNRR